MASDMSEKVKRLESACAMLSEMSSRLAGLMPTMLGLMTQLAAQERFAPLGIAQKCRDKLLEGNPFSSSWGDAVESSRTLLGGEAADILLPLGEVLGAADLESQLGAISHAQKSLNLKLESAREDQKKKSGMLGAMGVLCGIAIAIFII